VEGQIAGSGQIVAYPEIAILLELCSGLPVIREELVSAESQIASAMPTCTKTSRYQ
jgi:hypothetical protein